MCGYPTFWTFRDAWITSILLSIHLEVEQELWENSTFKILSNIGLFSAPSFCIQDCFWCMKTPLPKSPNDPFVILSKWHFKALLLNFFSTSDTVDHFCLLEKLSALGFLTSPISSDNATTAWLSCRNLQLYSCTVSLLLRVHSRLSLPIPQFPQYTSTILTEKYWFLPNLCFQQTMSVENFWPVQNTDHSYLWPREALTVTSSWVNQSLFQGPVVQVFSKGGIGKRH